MPPRDRPTESLTYNNQDAQSHAEMLACLVLRSGRESTVITTTERQALFDRYPDGFGLLAFVDPSSGEIRLAISGGDGIRDAAILAAQIERQGGTLVPEQIPPSLLGDKESR